MDLDLSPSWPPPGRWRLGLLLGALLSAVIALAGLMASGAEWSWSLWIAVGIGGVLAVLQALTRWSASRKPRILRLKDDELTAVVKLIDQAAQGQDKGLAIQAREYLILHRRISKRDASAAVGKLLRRDYPKVADRLGYLD